MAEESNWGNCPNEVMIAKFLAAAFWLILNSMVLSISLCDDSMLREDLRAGKVSPIVFLSLVGVTGILYMRAAFMDPGFIPDLDEAEDMQYQDKTGKPKPPGQEDSPVEGHSRINEDDMDGGICGWGRSRDTKMKDAQRKQKVLLPCSSDITLWEYSKYIPQDEKTIDETGQGGLMGSRCNFCERRAPMRAKHCNSCMKCVSRYDHHCIWLGNCVGERNHGLFWWYLVFQSVCIIWGLVYIESAIKWSGFSDEALGAIEGFIWMNGLKILVFFFILLWAWLPLCLLVYHTFLLCTNQTTWEFNRRARITYLKSLPEDERPFDGGIIHNLKLLCCTPKILDWRYNGGSIEEITKCMASKETMP